LFGLAARLAESKVCHNEEFDTGAEQERKSI